MVELITGPMFSEKTTELLSRLSRRQIAGNRVILLRPSIDNRESLTHSGIKSNIPELFIDTKDFTSKRNYAFDFNSNDYIPLEIKSFFEEEINNYDVIGIDELQFFDEGIVKVIDDLANKGKIFIVSGLNGTAERQVFPTVSSLLPLVDNIIHKTGVCLKCGSDYGAFSIFKAGPKTEAVVVGGKDDYSVLCRKCYYEERG